VVFDGPARLVWHRAGPDRWTLAGLWPSESEATEVAEIISRGGPLLVIFDRRPEPVYVLAEELAEAPPAVAALAPASDRDVAELRVPRLTWLPEQLQRRGQRFLRDATDLVARTPAPLLPPLVLEAAREAPANVRFALRVRAGYWSDADLAAVVDHTFGRHHRPPVRHEGKPRWPTMADSPGA
jgi:hypothetical protein